MHCERCGRNQYCTVPGILRHILSRRMCLGELKFKVIGRKLEGNLLGSGGDKSYFCLKSKKLDGIYRGRLLT